MSFGHHVVLLRSVMIVAAVVQSDRDRKSAIELGFGIAESGGPTLPDDFFKRGGRKGAPRTPRKMDFLSALNKNSAVSALNLLTDTSREDHPGTGTSEGFGRLTDDRRWMIP
jgi:hypothetical protein